LRKTLRLIHLSDFHVTIKSVARVRHRLQEVVSRSQAGPAPDLVLATGDIASSGKAEEYYLAGPLLSNLMSGLKLSPDRLIVTPGNHDVDRALVDEILEMGLQAKAKRDPEEAAQFLISRRAEALAPQRAFFEHAAQHGFTTEPHIFSIDQFTVGCAPLNSSWRSSSDQDRGQLMIGSEQVRLAAEAIRGAELRIALCHHPLEWLSEADVRQIPILFKKWFQIVCSGHRHSNESFTRQEGDAFTYYSVAKAVDAEKYDQGYSDIQIGADGKILTTYLRWEPRRMTYVPDTELSDTGTQRGSVTLGPLSDDLAQTQRDTLRIATRTAALATRRIAQLAPRLTASGIFSYLDPPLQRSGQVGRLSLKLIAESPAHWLITGSPLSGKTTTLQLLQELIAATGATVFIAQAAMLDATDFHHALRSIANTSANKVTQMLSDGLVLLIDGPPRAGVAIEDQIQEFRSWTQLYPRLRVVVSTNQLPLVAPVEDNQLFGWERAELGTLSIDEVAGLAERCHGAGLLKIDSATTIRRLIVETFQSELPRHPWVVLLFLELCCTGEHLAGMSLAALLDRYTEIQLSRIDAGTNALSSDIGLRALQLTADLVYSTRNTRIPRIELARIIKKDYERAALTDDPSAAIDSLCKIGILQEEGNSVSFTLPVLLDFFYAKHLLDVGTEIEHELDCEDLRRLGGALAIVAGLRSQTKLAKLAFDAVRRIAPSQETTVALDALMLEAVRLTDDTFDSIDESAVQQRHELDAKLKAAESARGGNRAAEIERSPDKIRPPDLTHFIECYATALNILRASAFTDAATKRVCVSAAIDFSMSIAASFEKFLSALEQAKGLWSSLEKLSTKDRSKVTSVLSALMFVVSSSLLGLAGGSRHLEITLGEYLRDEPDEARAMTALMWLLSIAPSRAGELTDDFLARSLSISCLNILSFWLLGQYYVHSIMERRKDARWRDAFRSVALAVAKRSAPDGANNSAANNAADSMVRNIDRKIAAADAMRPAPRNR
jgi:hypothetical protein